jgi:thymidylate synthase
MRILAILQGNYGNRIIKTLKKYKPEEWTLEVYTFPSPLPAFDEDSLTDLLPKRLPAADLLLLLTEDPIIAELVPDMVKMSKVSAVLAPVANRSWLPAGLANQIRRKLDKVSMVMPVPFCTLGEDDTDNKFIKQFAQHFGKPRVEIEQEQGKVKKVTVLKDAPCGNTRFVAKKIVGTNIKDAYFEAGLLHHAHVCYATMVMDREFGDTLMHRSGLAMKDAVAEAISNKR